MYLLQDFVNFLENIEAVPRGLKEKIDIPTLSDGEGVRNIEFDADRLETILEYLEKYEYASCEHVVWVFHSHTGRRPGALHSLDVEDLHLDCEDPYLELHHRPEETSLKNGKKGEDEVGLSERVAQIFKDYIQDNRTEVTTATGRRPFLTSEYGRLSKSTMRRYIYRWSRPCDIGAGCPHNRDVQTCEAAKSTDRASKCPSSRPPYALRHGYITQMLRDGAPKPFLSDRCDVSEEVIEETYDERDSSEKRELRQELLNEMGREAAGGGYL
jgi:integrase